MPTLIGVQSDGKGVEQNPPAVWRAHSSSTNGIPKRQKPCANPIVQAGLLKEGPQSFCRATDNTQSDKFQIYFSNETGSQTGSINWPMTKL